MKRSKILHIAIIAAWLVIVGILVRDRVGESPQPPSYDALPYLEKAMAFGIVLHMDHYRKIERSYLLYWNQSK